MKCDCCGKKEAVRKDYRSNSGVTGSYRVCDGCFYINDKSFWRKRNKRR